MDAYVDDLFDPVFDQGPPVSIVQLKKHKYYCAVLSHTHSCFEFILIKYVII